FHIQDPNVAVDTSCCSTLNPHTALMMIYYWKLDNKQVTILFRGGLLGIVIPAARVLCSCWQVFISASVLFLLIDSLLDVFAGELNLLKSISSGIDETDCDPEEDIRIIERLLYDNSSPRPPKEFISKNSNADIQSFSPSPIPVKDNVSFMEEIDLSFTSDDPMPPSIEEDDDDSERDIIICRELLNNHSLSLPVIESYHFDIPSFSRPPAKPPDGNTGILNIKMRGDNSEQKVPIPELTITRVLNQEKSPDLLSHRSLEIFQLSAKCLMMIHGMNTSILDVPLFHSYPLDQFYLLHLAGSQPMLKSSYKAEASVIISIPPLVEGVADVVVEIKGIGWSISITFQFSVGLQTPDDLSRSRLVKDKQKEDKIGTKPDKNGKRGKARRCFAGSRIDGIMMSLRGWKVFSEKHFSHLLKCGDRIPWKTIKPSGGMMCQGVRIEILTKGVIGDPFHFDTLGDAPKFVKMLVSIVTRKSMKLERILDLLDHIVLKSKIRCLNPTIQRWLAQLLHRSKVGNW
nr:hypothetical protein [Tanacetum cinerariifolium]